jgi:transposase-like protein
MHEALDGILWATSLEKARTACNEAAAQLDGRADAALRVLEDATAVLAVPAKYRRRLRTSIMLERFIEEIRRRKKVIRIVPDAEPFWRLVSALCGEQHEEWSTGRCYLTMDEFYRWKASAHDEVQSLPIAA